MKRILGMLLAGILVCMMVTTASTEEKKYKIGVFFWHESANDYVAFEGIKDGFKTAGVDYEFDIQKAFEDEDKTNKIIKVWTEQKPDLIYAMGTESCQSLMKVIHDTPIVFTAVTNPVQSGITPNWKTSGRNITGNSNWIPTEEILGHFKSAAPTLKTLGVMYEPDNPISSVEVNEAKKVAKKMDINLLTVEIKKAGSYSAAEFSDKVLMPACKSLVTKKVDVIWVPIDTLVYKNVDKLRSITDPAKIPLFASSHRGVKEGAVLGVIVDYKALGKDSVPIALKILTQKVSPKDIPVGTTLGRRILVNRKAAKEIGYEIPSKVLDIADVVVK